MAMPPVLDAAAAAALAPPGSRIYLGGCAGEPLAVLAAVRAEPDLWRGVTLTGAFIPGVNDADYSGIGLDTRVETIFATQGLRTPAGTEAHLPLHYSQFWGRLRQRGLVDLVDVTVAPPRADGTVGLGIAGDFAPAPLAAGAGLIGIVNPNMPDVANGPRLPLHRFAGLVEASDRLPTYYSGPVSDDLRRIAGHVLGLIRQGDTLQLGLGKGQTAVLEALSGASLAGSSLSGLGLHAGMISPAILEPLRRGVFSRGVVTGVAMGDAGFYAALAGLAQVRFAPVGHTHDPVVLAGISQLVSINSVLEIDLSGQANAEAIGGKQVSRQGGLVDFHRQARSAVLMLGSVARGGASSRIVPHLAPGTPVSVSRADVDIVVTEHGVARLRGLSLAERAEALIRIADPRHQAWLREAAR